MASSLVESSSAGMSQTAAMQATTPAPVDSTIDTTVQSRRRRPKPQLSCTLCRQRKLRCDRKQPCSRCASRDVPCSYAESPITGVAAPSLQDRIVQLERLIMLQMPSSQEAKGEVPAVTLSAAPSDRVSPQLADPIDVPSECGSLGVGDSELRYVGGEHWAAILDSITDLKHQVDREEKMRLIGLVDGTPFNNITNDPEAHSIPPAHHALLLYGCPRPSSREEILSALPPRVSVDRYLSRYFTCLELASCTVHGPTFLEEYEAFWAKPSEASIIWVGLLFSIICLSVITSDAADATPGHERDQALLQADLYRKKILQCLVLGQYTRAGPYVSETLLHYLHIEFATCTDANKDTWFLLALTVKIAMTMGYHRDPSHFPKLTPLQNEMRRRVWATLVQADVLISSQMGMPRIIADWQWDTAEPQNLNDADLDRKMTQVPAPRPETEHTTSLGIIARIRILKIVGQIADLSSAVTPCSYSEITRFDELLREAQAAIPKLLQPKTMATSVTDSPQVIMARLFISQIFYKGQIMLHRRFLYLEPPSHEQASYAYSRKVCLDAALGLLEIQYIMDEETCPAGQLHMMRWRLSSSLNHQFLTATMLLCSLLYRGLTLGREGDIIAALQRARTIWMRNGQRSQEARKAADTTNLVLARVMMDDHRALNGLLEDAGQVAGATSVNAGGSSGAVLQSLYNLDVETGIDPSRIFQELVQPDADVPFQPDLFQGYTPPIIQSQAFSSLPNTEETQTQNLGLEEWMSRMGVWR